MLKGNEEGARKITTARDAPLVRGSRAGGGRGIERLAGRTGTPLSLSLRTPFGTDPASLLCRFKVAGLKNAVWCVGAATSQGHVEHELALTRHSCTVLCWGCAAAEDTVPPRSEEPRGTEPRRT